MVMGLGVGRLLFIILVERRKNKTLTLFCTETVGLVRTVVSISHCGCDDPGSIPGLDKTVFAFLVLSMK